MNRELANLPGDAGDGLCTARLRLRRFDVSDLPLLQRLNADPEVMRHLGGPKDSAATATMLERRILAYYQQHPGLGVWATLLRDGGECIGFHLLNHIQGETLIQVGYCLFRRHWGRGYATEMSVALLRYGFARLELPVISGITDQANLASQRVLLKAGLQRRGQRSFTHPAYAAAGPLAYFECRSVEWLATFSAQPESRIDEAL